MTVKLVAPGVQCCKRLLVRLNHNCPPLMLAAFWDRGPQEGIADLNVASVLSLVSSQGVGS